MCFVIHGETRYFLNSQNYTDNMDELKRLCVQELMEELMDTASSSDEDDEREQNMNVLTYLCAQNLIDDLMDSSASSSSDDDDDEFFAILGYTHWLVEAEKKRKSKDQNTVSAKHDHDQGSREGQVNGVIKSSISKANGTDLNDCRIPNLTAKRNDYPLLKELLTKNSGEPSENTNENVSNYLREATVLKRYNDNDSVLSACNLQSPLDEDVIDSLSDNEFNQYFHINRDSLTYLVERFSSWYCKDSYEQTSHIPNIKTTILTFLWFCANPVSLKSVTQMFKASFMDSKESLDIVLDFFEKELASEVIKLPTSYVEKESIAKDFEKIDGFPNVLGCVATVFITLKIPEPVETCDATQMYIRGICDSNRKFSFIKITFSEDSKNDMFLEKGLPKLCFPKYHLLGDATCLIRDHLVIPYENTENLNEPEKYFNTKLHRTHVKIKEAFDNLTNRFRQLKYLDFNNSETLSKFVTACCVIHNICIDRQDIYNETEVDNESYRQFHCSSPSGQSDDFLKDLGLMKRCELTQIFFRTKK